MKPEKNGYRVDTSVLQLNNSRMNDRQKLQEFKSLLDPNYISKFSWGNLKCYNELYLKKNDNPQPIPRKPLFVISGFQKRLNVAFLPNYLNEDDIGKINSVRDMGKTCYHLGMMAKYSSTGYCLKDTFLPECVEFIKSTKCLHDKIEDLLKLNEPMKKQLRNSHVRNHYVTSFGGYPQCTINRTTIEAEKNRILNTHTDRNDYGISVLMYGGNYDLGGDLVIPNLNLTIPTRPGDALLFNAKRYPHGVSKLELGHIENPDRISIVYYAHRCHFRVRQSNSKALCRIYRANVRRKIKKFEIFKKRPTILFQLYKRKYNQK